jgi:hypothetical protein
LFGAVAHCKKPTEYAPSGTPRPYTAVPVFLPWRRRRVNVGGLHKVVINLVADAFDRAVKVGISRQNNRDATRVGLPHSAYDRIAIAGLDNVQVRQKDVERPALYFVECFLDTGCAFDVKPVSLQDEWKRGAYSVFVVNE